MIHDHLAVHDLRGAVGAEAGLERLGVRGGAAADEDMIEVALARLWSSKKRAPLVDLSMVHQVFQRCFQAARANPVTTNAKSDKHIFCHFSI